MNKQAMRLVVLAVAAAMAIVVAAASAGTLGPITFETPAYHTGSIDGQNGWSKSGGYDANVVTVASYPAASGYGFGKQALQISDAVTSGSFGDQTFSPAVAGAAGESAANSHFDATFRIGTALATLQSGLHLSVSPDDGQGSRMSYLRFEDQAGGVHVFFDDVTDPGPVGTVADFNETDIATIDRAHAHTVRFSVDFVPGPGNDVVKIYIDGVLKATGTTWEDYYRYDPEQAGNLNVVPSISKLLFREGGDANPSNLGKGFLVDGVSLATGTTPASKDACKKNGFATLTRADGSSFKNQGDCEQYINTGK